jgi:hypothetical protein
MPDIVLHPIHLGLGASAEAELMFNWYLAYGARHASDVEGDATALFITAGQGTEHRPR